MEFRSKIDKGQDLIDSMGGFVPREFSETVIADSLSYNKKRILNEEDFSLALIHCVVTAEEGDYMFEDHIAGIRITNGRDCFALGVDIHEELKGYDSMIGIVDTLMEELDSFRNHLIKIKNGDTQTINDPVQ